MLIGMWIYHDILQRAGLLLGLRQNVSELKSTCRLVSVVKLEMSKFITKNHASGLSTQNKLHWLRRLHPIVDCLERKLSSEKKTFSLIRKICLCTLNENEQEEKPKNLWTCACRFEWNFFSKKTERNSHVFRPLPLRSAFYYHKQPKNIFSIPKYP